MIFLTWLTVASATLMSDCSRDFSELMAAIESIYNPSEAADSDSYAFMNSSVVFVAEMYGYTPYVQERKAAAQLASMTSNRKWKEDGCHVTYKGHDQITAGGLYLLTNGSTGRVVKLDPSKKLCTIQVVATREDGTKATVHWGGSFLIRFVLFSFFIFQT